VLARSLTTNHPPVCDMMKSHTDKRAPCNDVRHQIR
jgi:hypothetical protein